MPKRASSILDLIGGTPLVKLRRIVPPSAATVLVKIESFNPGRSTKDRTALSMIEAAEKSGKIAPGRTTIIEASSGSSGISLAMVCAVKGYRLIIVMPGTSSVERRRILAALGAEIRISPAADYIQGAIAGAEALCEKMDDACMLHQGRNPANPDAHFRTTGPEIWEATGGKIDAFVAAYGTGGTLTGIGRYLREKEPSIRICTVEPAGCPLLSEGKVGKHAIPGLSAGFIPEVFDTGLCDEVITVTDDEAKTAARRLAGEEGILAGFSSGANVFAACKVAQRLGPGKVVVTVLPDTGERYLTTELFAED